jgi:Transposase DDE domain/Insertion element 4 transposase N-terminal
MRHALNDDFGTMVDVTAAFVPGDYSRVMGALSADWIAEALLSTGTATVRQRRLPQEQLIWLVIGMALLRNLPITDVVRRLELPLPAKDGDLHVAPAAVAQGRQRLGSEALEWLFLRCGEQWATTRAQANAWHGLAVFGVDGTVLRVPDSPENRAHFGASEGTGVGSYPSVRLTVLKDLRSHVLAAAAFGPCTTAELRYAQQLWDTIPAQSVVLLDRAYLDVRTLHGLDTTARQWVTRAKSSTQWTLIKKLGRNDTLVELQTSKDARRQDPTLPKTWQARAISYQRKGFRPSIILTSLLDAAQYPAAEVVALYHERWELELGFRDIKSTMLAREEAIRSKSPSMVTQEIWGLLIAYNLVRLEMVHVATALQVAPTQISFIATFREVIEQWREALLTTSLGAIPKQLAAMRARLCAYMLPPRRPERSYPRAVKLFNSKYPSRTTVRKSSTVKAVK